MSWRFLELDILNWTVLLTSCIDLLYWIGYWKLELRVLTAYLNCILWDFLKSVETLVVKVLVTYSTWLVASPLVTEILIIESYLTGPGLCRSYLQNLLHLSTVTNCVQRVLWSLLKLLVQSLYNPDTNSSESLIKILFEALAYRFELPGLLAWQVSYLKTIYTSTSTASITSLLQAFLPLSSQRASTLCKRYRKPCHLWTCSQYSVETIKHSNGLANQETETESNHQYAQFWDYFSSAATWPLSGIKWYTKYTETQQVLAWLWRRSIYQDMIHYCFHLICYAHLIFLESRTSMHLLRTIS